jgi:hypothetical protein
MVSRKSWAMALLGLSGILVALALVSFFLARQPSTKAGMASAIPVSPAQATPDLRPTLENQSNYEEGKALFVDKGCITCHKHTAVAGLRQSYGIGPELTRLGDPVSVLPSDPSYLKVWLKDPKAIRPNTAMPNLNLSDEEIAELLAGSAASPAGGS